MTHMHDNTLNSFSSKLNRNIFITTDISQNILQELIQRINEINEEDNKNEKLLKKFKRKKIKIYISSFGGEVYTALGIFDLIKNSKTKINTYVYGTAMSAGLIIFLAGHKRFVSKYTTIMIHELSSLVGGKLEDLSENIYECTRLQNILNTIILDNTNISKKEVKRIQKERKDFYLSSEECLKYGICHEIISGDKEKTE